MDELKQQIKKFIFSSMKKYLPDVKPEEFEGNGSIYYMNAQNGTEWDFFVNKHLPYFMVFYNTKENLGAVKLSYFTNGEIIIYIYNEEGKKLFKKLHTKVDIDENELIKFAALLKVQMDDKGNWDASIGRIDTSIEPSEKEINDFKNAKNDFEKERKSTELLNKLAYVSKKITDDGYKVGFMLREEPVHPNDSGWQFMAGDEDDNYLNNENSLSILPISELNKLDPVVFNYLDKPVGTALIRISSNEFEEDRGDKEVFMEKRSD